METPAKNISAGIWEIPREIPLQKYSLGEYLLLCHVVNQNIPDFWTTHPREWFYKFEAYMNLQNQKADEYKFDIVITKLKDTEAICAISDIIENRSESGKYETLKKRLINVFHVRKNESSVVKHNESLRRVGSC